ncbi:nucleotidyltransferase domain-containing protein [Halomonas alkalicola]|uniref:Nucleotidyltransferase domain-containing protein n=1 Tax=Halomonas alkalicola TaxID=1930622 RepID=A0ABY9H573_9GAMM|nr:nucleotidyltransferase domain-containing protein [Halomonas alkalicola]WLI73363.1 nucleotidyltransferase domain-containing protein [Halomonas alkalicola]
MPDSQRILSQRDLASLTAYLAASLPSLQAVYLFGSQAKGEATRESDVDLALLLAAPLPPEQRWQLSGELADRLSKEIDLIDLRQASTVLQHQVVTTGERLWHLGSDSDEFELTVQSEYWDLAIQRRALIADIKERGSVHGR